MLEFNELFRKIKEENATKFGEVAELAKKEERKNKMISAIIGFFLSIFIITKLLGLTNDPLVMGGANESVVTKILIICVCIFQLVKICLI